MPSNAIKIISWTPLWQYGVRRLLFEFASPLLSQQSPAASSRSKNQCSSTIDEFAAV
jgi:hypothetical protein